MNGANPQDEMSFAKDLDAILATMVGEMGSEHQAQPAYAAVGRRASGDTISSSSSSSMSSVWQSIQVSREQQLDSAAKIPGSMMRGAPFHQPLKTSVSLPPTPTPLSPERLDQMSLHTVPTSPSRTVPLCPPAAQQQWQQQLSASAARRASLLAAAADDIFTLDQLLQSDAELRAHVDFQSSWCVSCDQSSCNAANPGRRRTAMMVAAAHGSMGAVIYLLQRGADINCRSGDDGFTALHCATASGSLKSGGTVKMLLQLGADPMVRDALGRLPMELIPRQFMRVEDEEGRRREVLRRLSEERLAYQHGDGAGSPPGSPGPYCRIATRSPDLEAKQQVRHQQLPGCQQQQQQSPPPPPPSLPHGNDDPTQTSTMLEMPEYCTDTFRMFQFKVVQCCRPEDHNWRECPYVHVGETAKRRDPRVFKYSGNPCPDFRRGSCRNGDGCRFAHGVFESWLHPSKYRTKMCKEGEACTRRVCFFAHTADELRAAPPDSAGSASPEDASSLSRASTPDCTAAGSSSIPEPVHRPLAAAASHASPPMAQSARPPSEAEDPWDLPPGVAMRSVTPAGGGQGEFEYGGIGHIAPPFASLFDVGTPELPVALSL